MPVITHMLSPKEKTELLWALKNHEDCKDISLELSNDNGIGVAIKVHCVDCDKVMNITDFSTW